MILPTSLLSRIRSLWRHLFRRAQAETSLDDELEAYVEELAAEHRQRGLSEAEARRAALLELGGMDQVKESVREAWMGRWIHDLWRDLRYSMRALRSRPGFTAIAVLTLALGLGGATAVFSIMDGVLFRPPPGISDPGRVVAIDAFARGVAWDGLSYPELQDLRETAHAFSGIAGHVDAPVHLREADGSRESVMVDFVSGDYFRVLGIRATLGRLLTGSDADPHGPRSVLVLGYDFWKSHFGGDRDVLGRTLDLNDVRFAVVGVASRGFGGTVTGQEIQAWAPLPLLVSTGWVTPAFTANTKSRMLSVLGRLAPGAELAGARAELRGRGETAVPEFGVTPQHRRHDDPFFLVLGSAVALLLLLACANVAALFLLRASSRRHELAARLALGASRLVLARQQLIEGTLIVATGAVLGGGGADLVVKRISSLQWQYGKIAYSIDGRVLAFTLAAAALTVVLVTVLPVLRLGRVAPMTVLRSATAGTGRRVSPAQRALVVFQIAASLALVATASMIFTRVRDLVDADVGFDGRNVAMVYFDPRQAGYDAARTRQVIRRLDAAANAEPEITSATLATAAPLLGRGFAMVFRDGQAPQPGDSAAATAGEAGAASSPPRGLKVGIAAVEPSYFHMLGIPLRAGRPFGDEDGPAAPRVAIVSQALARQLWGSEDAVGRYLEQARRGPPARLLVVGVAANVKHTTLWGVDQPVLYVPIVQVPPDGTLLIARGRSGLPSQAVLTRLLAGVDPDLYPDGVWTMNELKRIWIQPQRTVSTWIGVFGLLAVLLSALGVYGAVGHVVRERTPEMAVRCALGAEPRHLVMLAMREGLILSAAGSLGGALLLFWTQTVVRRLLEGMTGIAPAVVAGSALLLGLTMAAASYVPARRVARISPVEVLRQE